MHNIEIYLTLGNIYFNRRWFDESLKYFNLARDSYLKLWENGRTIWSNSELFFIEYKIACIYYHKGEIDRPLSCFENFLSLLDPGKVHTIYSTYTTILLNIYVGYLYNRLGNKEKYNYHIDLSLRIFEAYIHHSNFNTAIIFDVLPAVISQRDYKRCEKICLKLLEMLQDGENNKEKLIISICLMTSYVYQGNYEKSDEIFDFIESNLTQFNWCEDLTSQMSAYLLIGETFLKRKNYYKADIAFNKTKNILENYLKTEIDTIAFVYGRMGWNYAQWGKYDDSEYYLLKALDHFLNSQDSINNTAMVLTFLEVLYRKKNDVKNQKHYLVEIIKFCKEKNFYPANYAASLGLLINIYKQENDDANGIAYWYDLKEHLKKSNVDLNNADEYAMYDENGIEIGKVQLKEY